MEACVHELLESDCSHSSDNIAAQVSVDIPGVVNTQLSDMPDSGRGYGPDAPAGARRGTRRPESGTPDLAGLLQVSTS